ncbi:glycosyltransferase family 4 protein [Pantanalinema sp. GBBB05]|uniref:glycosyltransferase family 4 protein n=1 Tax=Pantanalinema sp. GBBB05 TaxID=2604139 RepID=UPI001DDD856C|nr:glycosyltransferase family 4 protein [Pantanalinema sp. GBBB05]
MSTDNLRVLIVAEHASLKLGGEASLPMHYFRILRQRGIEAWLIVHERTRDELTAYFTEELDRIYFIQDSFWHRLCWQLGKPLPHRAALFTTGFALRLLTQFMQLRLAQKLVRKHGVTIVHQPIPVSPKEPSMLRKIGVPVVIGPMNGGMNYPPAFQHLEKSWVQLTVGIGRMMSNLFNRLIPGKLEASVLLVANARTRQALPQGIKGKVIEIPENGVDLTLWQPVVKQPQTPPVQQPTTGSETPVRFVYIGRLIDWKAIDLLLFAFRRVAETHPAILEIIGDGPERENLQAQAEELRLTQTAAAACRLQGFVQFSGWLPQTECAQRLETADVLVMPSLMECGGAAALEAMAMGLPVIATNWGGFTDYLNASCGILVEPSSPVDFIEGLAAAMIRLASNPELRQLMGQAGRQRVLDHFNWDRKIDHILEIYQEAIDQGFKPVGSQPIATDLPLGKAATF